MDDKRSQLQGQGRLVTENPIRKNAQIPEYFMR